MKINLDGYEFEHVSEIEPLRNPDGSVQEFMPQSRYANRSAIKLNKYGQGPFCKFKIPNRFNHSGVYAVIASTKVMYIGETINLSTRYNMGYGNISPRNCFLKGQETNCRLNNLICHAAKRGEHLSLWILKTDNYKVIEANLRASLKPEWNRI